MTYLGSPMKGPALGPKIGKYGRAPFDPDRTFTATRNLILNGKLIEKGTVFEKTLVNTRRLRQMYEQRMLDMQDEDEAPVSVTHEPIKPDFDTLSNEGLRIWLRNNGYIARPKMPREKLLQLVEQKWKEYMDGLASATRTGKATSEGVSGKAAEGDASQGTSHNSGRVRGSRSRSSANLRNRRNT